MPKASSLSFFNTISRYLDISIIIDCFSVAKLHRKYVECVVKNVERRTPNASSVFFKTITNLEPADNNAMKAPYAVALRTLTNAFTNPFRHLYFKHYRDFTLLKDMPPNYLPSRFLSGAPPCYCTDGGLVRMRLTRGSSERASSTALAC